MSSPTRSLLGITLTLVVTFFASTIFVDYRVRRIDYKVHTIVVNSAPSVQELAMARTELRRLETGVGRQLSARASGLAYDGGQLRRWRASLDQHLERYTHLPLIDRAEREVYLRLDAAKRDFDDDLNRVSALTVAGRLQEARAILFDDVDRSAERVDALINELVLLNNQQSMNMATDIAQIRRRATLAAEALDVASAILALVLAVFTTRAVRHSLWLREEGRRLAEERAEELDRFASVVAHDLKAPLAAMMVSSELALQAPELRERSFNRIRRAAHSMAGLIDGLLDFAHAGSHPRAGAQASVAPVLSEVIDQLMPTARERGAQVNVEPMPADVKVACSPAVLASVLSNLLQNAIKYARRPEQPAPRVTVRARAQEQRIRCEVEDDGPGVPQGMEQSIFETWVRGKNSVGAAGLGLGLATVKRLVESHAGRVGHEPVAPHGSLFWVELPRVTDH